MTDIAALILDDHESMRRQFARLDDAASNEERALRSGRHWPTCSTCTRRAEEEVFYPRLLDIADAGEGETRDAIGDHNDIRDAVARARDADVGSESWWAAVAAARKANSDHMAEEEREALRSFRTHSDVELRARVGAAFLIYKFDHPTAHAADTRDKDPDRYVADRG